MDRDLQHLSDLVHQIYDASVHPERWNHVAAAIAASLDSDKGLLLTTKQKPQMGGLVFPAGITEANLQLCATHFMGTENLWEIGLEKRGLYLEGQVYDGDDMVPRDEFLASRFYWDFLSAQGIGQVCAGIVFAGSSGLPATALLAFRDLHERRFDESDKAWMKLLVSHVPRSLGLMMRLDTARVQNASLLASHDRLSFGVALLNKDMQVLHLNKAAHTVISRRDGLYINAHQQLESLPAATRLQNPARKSSRGQIKAESTSLSRWLLLARDAPMTDTQHFLDSCVVMRRGAAMVMPEKLMVSGTRNLRAAAAG
jgi:hypothetical protein